MQRSIINQKPLATFLYVAFFILYIGLSSIHLFLPPLFAVLYVLFSRALKKEDTFAVLLVSLCLIIFEAEKDYLLFSSIIYFVLIYKLVIPKFSKNFNCRWCINLATIITVYIGYFLFLSLLSNIFLLPIPDMSYFLIYYIIIEFFIVSIL
ncbi:MAG: hypothetical protein J7J31_04075 [Helicobacteraceae bacterium]|nr:hypothetical protein [Helicobacteraceae bacterium]